MPTQDEVIENILDKPEFIEDALAGEPVQEQKRLLADVITAHGILDSATIDKDRPGVLREFGIVEGHQAYECIRAAAYALGAAESIMSHAIKEGAK